MAKQQFETEVSIRPPRRIVVHLVRSDQAFCSNIFGVLFTIFFGLTTSLLGALVTATGVPPVFYVFLAVCSVFSVVFFVLIVGFRRWAYLDKEQSDSLEKAPAVVVQKPAPQAVASANVQAIPLVPTSDKSAVAVSRPGATSSSPAS